MFQEQSKMMEEIYWFRAVRAKYFDSSGNHRFMTKLREFAKEGEEIKSLKVTIGIWRGGEHRLMNLSWKNFLRAEVQSS